MLSRRRFLTGTSLTGLALGAPHVARSALDLQERAGARPQRIIHLVSDGLSMGTLTCADQLSFLVRGRGLSWMKLYSDPASRSGFMNMRSLNSIVTDSSAASSSWGSGSRIVNGAVNMLPDGQWLTPLYSLFADAGWARGLVTTTEITHATPAGFATNAWTRDNPLTIAGQYLERKIDVLLGGGAAFFEAAKRSDKRDLKGDFRRAGYPIVETLAELQAAPVGDRLLGLFSGSHLPFTIDQQLDPKLIAKVPTLAAMTRAALDRLGRRNRFILQVEGGRIDHAAHNSDAATALYEQLALDDALDVCIEFQRENPETLLVITTDHGNANFGLNGTGPGYSHSSPRLAHVQQVKASFPIILDRLKKFGVRIDAPIIPEDREDSVTGRRSPYKIADPDKLPMDPVDPQRASKVAKAIVAPSALEVSPQAIIDVIGDATGFKVSKRRAGGFARALAGDPVTIFDGLTALTAQLGQLMANRFAIGFSGNAHTGDYVPILAIGPGADRFQGFIDNTDVFTHYTQLAGIKFRNPKLPLRASGPSAGSTERVASYAAAVSAAHSV